MMHVLVVMLPDEVSDEKGEGMIGEIEALFDGQVRVDRFTQPIVVDEDGARYRGPV